MLIRLRIEGSQPLTGTAVIEGREPLRFDGWLESLTIVSELVAAAPPGDEDADTDERDNPGESDGRQVGCIKSRRYTGRRLRRSSMIKFGSDHRKTVNGSAGSPRELCGQQQPWCRRTAVQHRPEAAT